MKKLKENSLFTLTVLFAVLAVVAINIFFSVLSSRFSGLSLDLTENSVFKLDDTTKTQIKNLDSSVEIMVLASEEDFTAPTRYNSHANEIFKQFGKQSSHISISYIDYISNPTFSLSYPNAEMKHGDILVVSGEKYTVIPTEKLFNYESTQQGGLKISSSRAELAVSEAVATVTSNKSNLAVLTIGHQEKDSQGFNSLLKGNGYEVQTSSLLMEEIPNDTSIIFIISPQHDFNSLELEKLSIFLSTPGKNVFYFADATRAPLPALEAFIKEWGISVDSGLVFETSEERVFQYQPFYPQVDFIGGDSFQNIYNNTNPIIMPISKPLSVVYANRGNHSTTTLAEFGASSGVRPMDADESFSAEEADLIGPIPSNILSSFSFSAGRRNSNLVVFSSGEMISDSFIEGAVFGNAEYLLWLVSDLTAHENSGMVVPKVLDGSPLGISKATADTLGVVFIFVIPLFILSLGVIVWLRRRNK